MQKQQRLISSLQKQKLWQNFPTFCMTPKRLKSTAKVSRDIDHHTSHLRTQNLQENDSQDVTICKFKAKTHVGGGFGSFTENNSPRKESPEGKKVNTFCSIRKGYPSKLEKSISAVFSPVSYQAVFIGANWSDKLLSVRSAGFQSNGKNGIPKFNQFYSTRQKFEEKIIQKKRQNNFSFQNESYQSENETAANSSYSSVKDGNKTLKTGKILRNKLQKQILLKNSKNKPCHMFKKGSLAQFVELQIEGERVINEQHEPKENQAITMKPFRNRQIENRDSLRGFKSAERKKLFKGFSSTKQIVISPVSLSRQPIKQNIIEKDIIREKENRTPPHKYCFCDGISTTNENSHKKQDCETPKSKGVHSPCSAERIMKKSSSVELILQQKTIEENQQNCILRSSFYCKDTCQEFKSQKGGNCENSLRERYEEILKSQAQLALIKQNLEKDHPITSLRQSFSPKIQKPDLIIQVLERSPLLSKYQRLLPESDQIIYEEESDEQEQDSISTNGMKLSVKYSCFLFKLMDSGKIGVLTKENCKVELLTEYLRYFLTSILGKIQCKGQKYSCEQFTEEIDRMVEILERREARKITNQISLLAKRTDRQDSERDDISVSQFDLSVSKLTENDQISYHPILETERTTATVGKSSNSTNTIWHQLDSESFNLPENKNTQREKIHFSRSILTEELEDIFFSKQNTNLTNQTEEQTIVQEMSVTNSVLKGKKDISPNRVRRNNENMPPSFLKKQNTIVQQMKKIVRLFD